MHDGNGFLIQHLKLTNIFEKVRSTGIKLFLALTYPVSLFLCVCVSVGAVRGCVGGHPVLGLHHRLGRGQGDP